jgi:hypothetical protein
MDPFTNAFRIAGLRPLIGANFFDLLPSTSIRSLVRAELIMHEFFHFSMSLTAVGSFQRKLAYGLYAILFSMDDDDLRLHIPSWRVEGNDALAKLAPKIASVLRTVERDTFVVDETIATAATLTFWRLFLVSGRVSPEQHRLVMQAVRSNTHPAVWTACQRLERCEWFTFRAPEPEAAGRIATLLIALGNYAFSPAASVLGEYWAGRSPHDAPGPRLRRVLTALSKTQHQSLDEALAADALRPFLDLSPDRPCTTLGRQRGVVAEPDPLAEVFTALGLDPTQAMATHPVGRAVTYLLTGYLPRGPDDAPGDVALQAIVPLVTEEEDGHVACRFLTRLPLGRLLNQLGGKSVAIEEMWEDALGGRRPQLEVGRAAVMPAPEGVRLLWQLQALMEQLLGEEALRCLCGPRCNRGGQCECSELLPRVYERVRRDSGAPLPRPSCL